MIMVSSIHVTSTNQVHLCWVLTVYKDLHCGDVFVYLRCYKQYYEFVAYKEQMYFYSSGSWEVQGQNTSRFISGTEWFLIDSTFWQLHHMVEEARQLSGVSFMRELAPFKLSLHPHDLITSQRTPLPNSITLEVRIRT